MGCQRTVYINKNTYDSIKSELEDQHFENFSEYLNFAMRFTVYEIQKNGIRNVPIIDRKETVKVCVRINDNIANILIGMNFCRKSEIYDFALNFLKSFLGAGNPARMRRNV